MNGNQPNTNQDLLLTRRDNVETSQDFRPDVGPTCCAQRWILAYTGLWLGVMTYMFNSNISIAIVCMVKTESDNTGDQNITTIYETNDSTSRLNLTLDNPVQIIQNVSLKSEYSKGRCDASEKTLPYISERAEFDWNKKTLSFVLSGYFYGYMVTQIPGGWLTAVFGGKHVISTFMATCSALTLLIPVFARTSVYLLVVARALIGMCLGVVVPGYCGLVGIWALPTERSRFMALLLFGTEVSLNQNGSHLSSLGSLADIGTVIYSPQRTAKLQQQNPDIGVVVKWPDSQIPSRDIVAGYSPLDITG